MTVLWHTLKARNNWVFGGSKPNARDTMQLARIMQQSAKKWGLCAQKTGQRGNLASAQVWIAPVEGILKINVDGSLGEGSTEGAIACICLRPYGVPFRRASPDPSERPLRHRLKP